MAARRRPPLLLVLATLGHLAVVQAGPCKEYSLDFILLQGDALSAQIEDDIKADLAEIGITVNTRLLEKAEFNTAMQEGDFHMCFTESWGPPYDPHAFATGWFRPKNEAHYPAMAGLEPPMTMAQLQDKVTAVLKTENLVTRQERWTEILQEMHNQAISNPMWSRRMPAVVNRRVQGYVAGAQQFDYPMHQLEVTGDPSVTVAPGAQTGLFVTTGPMDPHTYRPNEFFISNWLYEGLVSYGNGGVIEPMLATSWTVTSTGDGGEEYEFTLREGVTFHDGTAFDCQAVKLNFDHVLQPPLNSLNYHGWYHLPLNTESWECQGEKFVVKVKEAYYPFLQELSLIRPLRILSPESFADGPSTDPVTKNSCNPEAWANVENEDGSAADLKCAGIRSPVGTGPWIFNGTVEREDESIDHVVFKRNPNHWKPQGNIAELIVKNFASSTAVENALVDGSLDMVVGGGVLTPTQVKKFQTERVNDFQVVHGPPLLNTIIVMNAARSPTDDLHLRKVLMHGINKAAIVQKELGGSATVADSLFPKDAPYCDIDLTPRFDYDFDKAELMNCPEEGGGDDDDGADTGMIVGLSVGIGVFLIIVIGALCFFIGRRAGYNRFGSANG